MDNSPEFLNMCMKAEEIQKTWEPRDSDFYIAMKKSRRLRPVKISILNDWETRNHIIEHRDLFIWIPRLDQLQEIVDWKNWECRIRKKDKLEMHYISISGKQNSGIVTGKSMEQLWIAFVMKEKYEKVWDSKKEEWISAS
ncbi:MAG: hypothetical protein AB1638_07415 [Nitrospirota bacterium]